MQPILRQDGNYVVYRVEILLSNDWSDAGGNGYFIANIPEKLRFEDNSIHYKHLEPFNDFSASGKCWQQIGLHATRNIEYAEKMMELLAKYNPGYHFRIVRHIVKQERFVIAELSRNVPSTRKKDK